MSAMADLDIVLTKHKLSDAQKNAVVELLGGGFTSAKPNTIKSLEKKGLVINKGDFYLFEESFKGELKATREVYTNQIMADPEVSQEEVDIFKAVADTLTPERFNWQLGVYSNTLMGYGDVYKWDNNRVWHGLTAQEIREDMDTALPIGRKARRERARLARKVLSAV